tara:strand:- start:20476 stop:21051 length:576 start_codon:yes stop_codon:yes gene_type:complete
MKKERLSDIDSYIASFPADVREKLQKIRETVQKAAPGASEKISYAMPTFILDGNLVHFAAFKNHIGWYPTPSAILEFQEELSGYRNAKGSVQFPLDRPVPVKLISKMVRFRVEENLQKALARKKGKSLIKPWQSELSAPAIRALEQHGITTLTALSRYSEKEILALHGIGKTALPKLRMALSGEGRSFKGA